MASRTKGKLREGVMEGRTKGEDILEELEAQSDVWNHAFRFITSMTLKCAVELGIPDAIDSHGGPTPLSELAAMLSIPPRRIAALRRLMRTLVHSGCFAIAKDIGDGKEDTYVLTPFSRLLLKAKRTSASPIVLSVLDPVLMNPTWHFLSAWFNGEERTPFGLAHGKEFFELARERPKLVAFSPPMACDSELMGRMLVSVDIKSSFFNAERRRTFFSKSFCKKVSEDRLHRWGHSDVQVSNLGTDKEELAENG